MISKKEQAAIQYIHTNVLWIFVFSITLLSLLMRIPGKDYISEDASLYLLKWFDQMKAGGGFAQLKEQVGDYNIPYQVFMAAISYLPFNALYMIKLFSVLFDYILALGCAVLVHEGSRHNRKEKALFAYAAIVCSLNVILNSSVWGQCDSIYVSFLIWALVFLIRRKYAVAFLLWGAAFAFKLQAVFLLPVFALYYLRFEGFSLLYILIIPAVNFVMCLPAMLAGRSQREVWRIYPHQMKEAPVMFINYPNFWGMAGEEHVILSRIAILLAAAVIGMGIVYLLRRKTSIWTAEDIIGWALWGAWSCVMLLPSMHDRYGYVVDILSIILVFYCSRLVWVAVVCNLVSLIVYSNYLFGWLAVDLKVLSIFHFGFYCIYTYIYYRKATVQGGCG